MSQNTSSYNPDILSRYYRETVTTRRYYITYMGFRLPGFFNPPPSEFTFQFSLASGSKTLYTSQTYIYQGTTTIHGESQSIKIYFPDDFQFDPSTPTQLSVKIQAPPSYFDFFTKDLRTYLPLLVDVEKYVLVSMSDDNSCRADFTFGQEQTSMVVQKEFPTAPSQLPRYFYYASALQGLTRHQIRKF